MISDKVCLVDRIGLHTADDVFKAGSDLFIGRDIPWFPELLAVAMPSEEIALGSRRGSAAVE